MARQVMIVDDLTGEEGASSRLFGWEGKLRSIDLTDENYEYFAGLVAEYVDASVIVGGMDKVSGTVVQDRRPLARPDAGRHTEEELRDVRAWADALGMKLPDGKIGIDVWTAFRRNDLTKLKPGRLPQAVIDREVKKQNGVRARNAQQSLEVEVRPTG